MQQAKIRYFDALSAKPPAFNKRAWHTEFLRTGRIDRSDLPEPPRQYLTYQAVAEQTGRKLETAGVAIHDKINHFHQSIQFPRAIFHRVLTQTPHLGYCHVTYAKSRFAEFSDVHWAFYVANFRAEIGEDENFFATISAQPGRMYFAVAITPSAEDGHSVIDRKVRGNGVIFQTEDPKTAMKNVLLLGAHDEAVRAIVRAL